MLYHGSDNFIFEIIEICDDSKELLLQRELYWKNHYGSFKHGYNSIEGIETFLGNIPTIIFQYDLAGNYLDRFESMKEAERAGMGNHSSICRALDGRQSTAGGYQWSTIKYDSIDPIVKPGVKRRVYQYDLSGNYMTYHDGMRQAMRMTNEYGVRRYGDLYVGRSHQWTTTKTDNIPKWIQKAKISINKFDPDGNYIESYDSIAEAGRQNNCWSQVIGKKAKMGLRDLVGGYIWSYNRELT